MQEEIRAIINRITPDTMEDNIDKLQGYLEDLTERKISQFITILSGKASDGYTRDTVTFRGSKLNLAQMIAINMADDEDLETIILGAAAIFLEKGDTMKKRLQEDPLTRKEEHIPTPTLYKS